MLDVTHPKINPQKMSPHDRRGDACNKRSGIADILAMHNAHKRRTSIERIDRAGRQWFYRLMHDPSALLLPDALDVRSKTADIVSMLLWKDCL